MANTGPNAPTSCGYSAPPSSGAAASILIEVIPPLWETDNAVKVKDIFG